MNLPSFRRWLPIITLVLIAALLAGLPMLDSQFFANARYGQCSRLSVTDPAQALVMARAWRAKRPDSAMAKHCQALALFGVKDYAHAAEAFSALAKETAAVDPRLSAELQSQAKRAYSAAGKSDDAKSAIPYNQLKNNVNIKQPLFYGPLLQPKPK